MSFGLLWYGKQLDDRPLLTKSITSGMIGAVGDCICQFLSSSSAVMKEDTDVGHHNVTTAATATVVVVAAARTVDNSTHYDWHRTGRFFIMGSLWVAPITNYWYRALSTRIVPGKTRTLSRITKRLVLDQFVFAPMFCPSFLFVLWLLEGRDDVRSIHNKLMMVAPEVIVANWKLWIPAMTINFSVVPLKYQVLFGTSSLSTMCVFFAQSLWN
jgi:protein Mpv17